MKLVTIRIAERGVFAFNWVVPRGFGAAYRETLGNLASPQQLSDMLLLVGYSASVEDIDKWSLRRRVDAQLFATREHLSASDNPVRRLPRPRWMPAPWRGPETGEDLWDGPGPTVIKSEGCGGVT